MNPRSPGTDLVVVLPGIMGSTLRHDGQLIWAPSAGTVLRAVRTLGRNLTALTLPEGIGDDHPGDGVEPVTVMPDLHAIPGLWTPVKGYDVLLDRLRRIGYRETPPGEGAPPGNLLPVPYDWRLSNRYNGIRLAQIVPPALDRWRSQGGRYADAQVVFICHSMGGLIARWYIERCDGAEHTRKLITLGTPTRGAAKALTQLVNGINPRLGRLAEPLTHFIRSLPSTHQLLPEYACIDHGADLLKLTEVQQVTKTPVPELSTAMISAAAEFHTTLQAAERARPAHTTMTHIIIGTGQATPTTASFDGGMVIPRNTYGPDDLGGDATVPLTGATPAGSGLDSNTLRRIADKHGNLQRNPAALDEIESILTTPSITARGPSDKLETRVTVPELLLAGEPLPVTVELPGEQNHGLRVTLTNEAGHVHDVRTPQPRTGSSATIFTDLPPGAYTVTVTGLSPTSPLAPISSDTLIWDDPA